MLEERICHGHWASLSVLSEYAKNARPRRLFVQAIIQGYVCSKRPSGKRQCLLPDKGLLLLTIKTVNLSRSVFLSHGNPLHGRHPGWVLCVITVGFGGHGEPLQTNTKLWLLLLPHVIKSSVSDQEAHAFYQCPSKSNLQAWKWGKTLDPAQFLTSVTSKPLTPTCHLMSPGNRVSSYVLNGAEHSFFLLYPFPPPNYHHCWPASVLF